MKYEQANILAQILDEATVQQDGAEWTVKSGDTTHTTIASGFEKLLDDHYAAKNAEPAVQELPSHDDTSLILPPN